MVRFVFFLLLLLSCHHFAFGVADGREDAPATVVPSFRVLSPADRVELPRHLYDDPTFRSQWWYVTGHLQAEDGRRFGFELTFFAVGVPAAPSTSSFALRRLFVVHAAVTDVAAERFLFRDTLSRGEFASAGAATDRFHIWLGTTHLQGDLEGFQLHTDNDLFSLSLEMQSRKPAVRNGSGGYSNKRQGCPECASLYFSLTDLAAAGELRIAGETLKVSGNAWFDRELNSDSAVGMIKGWDWFALRLEDGRQLMLYNLFRPDGSRDPASSGTLVAADGSWRVLGAEDFTIEATGSFLSRQTGARYPAGWRVDVPAADLRLRVEPLLADQEVVATYSTFNHYWEGACRVKGSVTGQAYVELYGY